MKKYQESGIAAKPEVNLHVWRNHVPDVGGVGVGGGMNPVESL